MPALRDFIGTRCPHCRRDILQMAPSSNRMPGEERAWCPSCHARMGLDDLVRTRRPGGFLGRLFGKPHRG